MDTLPGLVLIFVTFSIPLATWLMATFIRDIPIEIEDAGLMDGAIAGKTCGISSGRWPCPAWSRCSWW